MIRSKRCLWWIPVVFSALFCWGCKNSGEVPGKYLAELKEPTASISIKLQLGANGQGSWDMKGERVFFRWETQGQEVWLHTKSGGVVAGRILGRGVIEIKLPGAGTLSFRKI
jgi:hypothetical protein